MTKERRGTIAKAIQNLCVILCASNRSKADEAKFKAGLKGIVQQCGISRGVNFQNISLALQRSVTGYCENDAAYLWRLADDVEPRIRQAWNKYQSSFSRSSTPTKKR